MRLTGRAWLAPLLAAATACTAAPAAAPPPLRSTECLRAQSPAEAARAVRERLVREGWRDVVVEPHPALPGRWSVRAAGLAGKIEARAAGCAGARLSLWRAAVAPGAGSRRAGPLGPRHTRIPPTP